MELSLPKRTRNTISKIAGIALEHLPMSFSSSDTGMGRKVLFPIPMKNKPDDLSDFLYVYAESKLPKHPKDKIVGFTLDDVETGAGIYLWKKEKSHYTGKSFPVEALLGEVITDLSLRNRLIYKVTEMKNIVRLDEEFLELANLERTTQREVRTSVHVLSKEIH